VSRRRVFVGIDTGKHGAMVALDEEKRPLLVRAGGYFLVGDRASDYDEQRILTALDDVAALGGFPEFALERTRGIPGMSAISTWGMGHGYGLWKMALTARTLTHRTPFPQQWQRVLSTTEGSDIKTRSIKHCQAQVPALNLRPNTPHQKPHDGLADAANLALWLMWIDRAHLDG
jgi:hypothetical protein